MAVQRSLSLGRSNADRQRDAAKRKEVFLLAYEEHGTIRGAAKAAGIARDSYKRWHAEDMEFVRRLDEMKQSFAESLEGLALERVRNPDKNRGSDLLLTVLLNANMPSKYRPQTAMSEDSAKELIIEWRRASREVKKDVEIDGGVEEMPVSDVVEKTLAEILERRGNAVKEGKVEEGGEPEHQDAPA